VYALWTIFPYAPRVAYVNIPYVAWVTFATILQFSITSLNSKDNHS
jgi:tryptophan-rich sensory protein